MRPPAAIFFGFLQVNFHNACTQEIGIALVNQITIGSRHKRCAPEGEFTFGTDTVGRKHEGAVRNGMATHYRHPAVLLARVNFGWFRLHPANGGGVDQNVCALQAHNAGGFREPLVPANQHAQRTGRGLDGFKTGIARNKVVLLVESRVIRNVTLAVKTGNASVAFKHKGTVMVNAAGPLFKEREHDNGIDFFGNALPLLDNGAILFDGHVKEVGIFFERKIRRMEHFGENDQVDSLALKCQRLFNIPLIIAFGIPRPLALQGCCLDFVHVPNLDYYCSTSRTNSLHY